MTPADHTCHICAQPVTWGTPICPRCGAALEWTEHDEDDPLVHLMPPDWRNGGPTDARPRWLRLYPVVVLAVGLLLTILSLLPAGLPAPSLLIGIVFLAAGILALATRRPHH